MAIFNFGKSRNKEVASTVVNSAKTLLANIRFMDVDNPIRSIAVTSAVPNEGKTFVAANLASAIATSGKTVLLVETDMRRRSMSHVLGVHAQNGVYSVLAGEIDLRTAAVNTQTPNLYFLDCEPRIPNPSDLLNSNRFTRLIEHAIRLYDYVVFDTPPVGTFIDAAVLGTKVDAVFMVVREGFTRKAEVAAAAEQLKKSGCNLAGIIMNYCERQSSEYYYDYYYTRGEKGDATNAPQMPKSRPRRRAAQSGGAQPVPSAPPARRAASRAQAEPAQSAPAADDTGVYERLAEQLAQSDAQASSSASEAVDGAATASTAGQRLANPYIPTRSEDEF